MSRACHEILRPCDPAPRTRARGVDWVGETVSLVTLAATVNAAVAANAPSVSESGAPNAQVALRVVAAEDMTSLANLGKDAERILADLGRGVQRASPIPSESSHRIKAARKQSSQTFAIWIESSISVIAKLRSAIDKLRRCRSCSRSSSLTRRSCRRRG